MNNVLNGGDNMSINTLNRNQQKAVKTINGPLLILAGAGSGKTTVLTHRIEHLINKNVHPENILAVTFTKKASEEMNERISKKIGKANANKIWIKTFHSMCTNILRNEVIELSSLKSDFSIYDSFESKNLMKDIIKNDLKLDPKTFTPNGLLYFVSMLKNEMIDVKTFEKMSPSNDFIDWNKAKTILYKKIPSEKKDVILKTYKAYQKKLIEQNAVDFDDLILHTINLFIEKPEILKKYHSKFQFIMVDEYQDTNHTQYVLIKLLAKKKRNIAVVGDDFQSIYKFRGSDIRNILNFDNDYPDAHIIKLEENYRCSPYVLNAANQIIAINKNQKDKKLYSSKQNGEKIGYFHANNEKEEARFVINEINNFINKGYKFGDFAILFRTNQQSQIFEEMLMRTSIPFQLVNGLKFLEKSDIKVIHSYLKFIHNSNDIYSFLSIINHPKRHISRKTLNKITQSCKNKDLLAFLKEPSGLSTQPNEKKSLTNFISLIEDLIESTTSLSLGDLVSKVAIDSGLFSLYNYFNDYEKANNLSEFINIAYEMTNNNQDATLTDFLSHLLMILEFDHVSDKNSVKLMTLHSAKGLEFPVVFLVGMEEGILPHLKSTEGIDLEEERRLCYVGFTRSKEKLFLSHAKTRTMWGKTEDCTPSRFLYEFSESLLDSPKSLNI